MGRGLTFLRSWTNRTIASSNTWWLTRAITDGALPPRRWAFSGWTPTRPIPSPIHPRGYYFDVVSGRVLDEYQLIYVVDGEGTLRTESGSYRLTAGTMFLIFPGGWHTYRPSPETGWSAYWIGFRGRVIDDRVGGGFFSGKSPVFRIGLSPLAVDVYREGAGRSRQGRPLLPAGALRGGVSADGLR